MLFWACLFCYYYLGYNRVMNKTAKPTANQKKPAAKAVVKLPKPNMGHPIIFGI